MQSRENLYRVEIHPVQTSLLIQQRLPETAAVAYIANKFCRFLSVESEPSDQGLHGISLTCKFLGCGGALLRCSGIVLRYGRKLLHALGYLLDSLRLALRVL